MLRALTYPQSSELPEEPWRIPAAFWMLLLEGTSLPGLKCHNCNPSFMTGTLKESCTYTAEWYQEVKTLKELWTLKDFIGHHKISPSTYFIMLLWIPNNIWPERQDTNPNLPKLNMKVETIQLHFLLLIFFPFPSKCWRRRIFWQRSPLVTGSSLCRHTLGKWWVITFQCFAADAFWLCFIHNSLEDSLRSTARLRNILQNSFAKAHFFNYLRKFKALLCK